MMFSMEVVATIVQARTQGTCDTTEGSTQIMTHSWWCSTDCITDVHNCNKAVHKWIQTVDVTLTITAEACSILSTLESCNVLRIQR